MVDQLTQTRSGPVPGLLERYLEKKAILTLLPNLELYQFGREAVVPNNAGREVFAPYWIDKTTAASIVDESATIETSEMSAASVSGALSEYVKAFKFSRLLFATKAIPMLEETTKQLMVSIAKGWENKIQGAISNAAAMSADAWLAGDRTTAYGSVTTSTVMQASVFSLARRKLAENFNPGYAERGGRYGAVIHPAQADHLRVHISGDTAINFQNRSMNNTSVYRNNVLGDLFGIDIVESPFSAKLLIENSGGMSNVTAMSGRLAYVFAPEAFFVAPLASARPEIILHGFGSGGTSDPPNRLATLAAYGVFDAFTKDAIRTNRMLQIVSGEWSGAAKG